MELTGGGWWSGHPRLLVVGARRKLNTEMFIPTITTHQTHVQSASWGVGGHSMYNGQFLWPVYCIKVRLQHITISSQLHVLEAQQKRHEKSHKKGQVVRLLKFILDMCRYIYVRTPFNLMCLRVAALCGWEDLEPGNPNSEI